MNPTGLHICEPTQDRKGPAYHRRYGFICTCGHYRKGRWLDPRDAGAAALWHEQHPAEDDSWTQVAAEAYRVFRRVVAVETLISDIGEDYAEQLTAIGDLVQDPQTCRAVEPLELTPKASRLLEQYLASGWHLLEENK